MAGGNRKPQDVSTILGFLIYNHSKIKENIISLILNELVKYIT